MSANSGLTSFVKWFRFFEAARSGRLRPYARRKIKYTVASKLLGKARWMK